MAFLLFDALYDKRLHQHQLKAFFDAWAKIKVVLRTRAYPEKFMIRALSCLARKRHIQMGLSMEKAWETFRTHDRF
jgi:hypothetical protein